MQTDFCGVGGYVDKMGYDLSLTRAPIEPIKTRAGARCAPRGYTMIHTREGHRPDLTDLPANKRWRSQQIGRGGHRRRRALRAHPGARRAGLGHHPRAGAAAGRGRSSTSPARARFCATDLELILRTRGIDNLILTGITTDVCVHTTMREANDRGFECLLLSDCTAATDRGNHEAALKMITMQGGVFGAHARPPTCCMHWPDA